MENVKKLYNAISNDYSLRRYTTLCGDVLKSIKNRYRTPIDKTDEQFTEALLLTVIQESKGSFRKRLEQFARELCINLDSLNSKSVPQ